MGMPFSSIISNAVIPPSPPACIVWLHAFWELSKPQEGLTPFEQDAYGHQNLILAEVIRREWDARYRVTGLKRAAKAEINAYGSVAHHLLKLIEKVKTHTPEKLDQLHEAEWFKYLFQEAESIGHAYSEEVPGARKLSGKDDLTELMGFQNQQLKTLSSNPYQAPSTKEFFDIALDLAITDDRFVRPLRDYVKARSDLLSLAKKNQERDGFVSYRKDAFGKAKRIRQGRKKTVSETVV